MQPAANTNEHLPFTARRMLFAYAADSNHVFNSNQRYLACLSAAESYKYELKSMPDVRSHLKLVRDDREVMRRVRTFVDELMRGESYEKKNDSIARNLMANASKANSDHEYAQAHHTLNDAMRFIPREDRTTLARCYGERSRLLARLSCFEAALADMEAAWEEYPKDRLYLLVILKYQCLMGLGREEAAEEYRPEAVAFIEENVANKSLGRQLIADMKKATWIKKQNPYHLRLTLSEENEDLINAKSNLRMEWHDVKERVIVGDDNIKKGELLVVDKPVVLTLSPHKHLTHCYHCMRRCQMRTIGCRQCSAVVYCSEKCQCESWEGYHETLCRITTFVDGFEESAICLRLVLSQGIEEFIEAMDQEQPPIEAWVGKRLADDLDSILSLKTSELKAIPDYYLAVVNTLIFSELFERLSLISGEDAKLDFCLALLKACEICTANAVKVADKDFRNSPFKGIYLEDLKEIWIGATLYTTSSMFSHRCFPNTYRTFSGGVCIIMATRDIPEGEEITVDYIGIAAAHAFEERKLLTKRSGFECACEDCVVEREPIMFKCPSCSGNLVISATFRKCVDCSSERVPKKAIENVNEASRVFDHILTARPNEMGNFDINGLNRAEDYFKQLLHKDHPSHIICYAAMIKFHEAKEDFGSAVRYHNKAIEHHTNLTGRTSMDVLQHLAQISLLYTNILKKRSRKGEDVALKYFYDCERMLPDILQHEILVLTPSQCRAFTYVDEVSSTTTKKVAFKLLSDLTIKEWPPFN